MNNLGYNKFLFILPFDHRSTFMKGMFGIDGRPPTNEETRTIKGLKRIIYEGFKKAIEKTIKKEDAAILVDEQFGEEILKDAVSSGIITLLTVEKSGQKEFALEYGSDFGEHIKKFNPDFAKALVRYNPEDPQDLKDRQRQKLKILSEFCHGQGYKFLVEVLIEPTEGELKKANGDKSLYDRNTRPSLAIDVVSEFQEAGIEPDVWKMEGMETRDSYQKLVNQAKADGGNDVGVVVLGRGAKPSQVEKWIYEAAGVPGVIGFAVGRTVFWEPLVSFRDQRISEEEAADQIAANFIHFYTLFKKGMEGR
ncbi:MAG: DUF2090 domain-containing protein [Patescibacteria group bacterium]|nr:DUF2090 domain-containing protein [Patescibacteria group bacterium]